MDTPEKKPKTPKQGTELDDKSKKRLEISKMIHPHNDEPDPLDKTPNVSQDG